MAAIMIAQIQVDDAEQYKEYQRQVIPTIDQFGGRVLAAEARPSVIEGEWAANMTVVIEWPSVECAQEWYDADVYADAKALRHRISKANLVFLRGIPR